MEPSTKRADIESIHELITANQLLAAEFRRTSSDLGKLEKRLDKIQETAERNDKRLSRIELVSKVIGWILAPLNVGVVAKIVVKFLE